MKASGYMRPSLVPADALVDCAWFARLMRPDAIRSHHLVVFVFDDVAVPDELAGYRERHSHARNLAGIRDDGVLPAVLPRMRRNRNGPGGDLDCPVRLVDENRLTIH